MQSARAVAIQNEQKFQSMRDRSTVTLAAGLRITFAARTAAERRRWRGDGKLAGNFLRRPDRRDVATSRTVHVAL